MSFVPSPAARSQRLHDDQPSGEQLRHQPTSTCRRRTDMPNLEDRPVLVDAHQGQAHLQKSPRNDYAHFNNPVLHRPERHQALDRVRRRAYDDAPDGDDQRPVQEAAGNLGRFNEGAQALHLTQDLRRDPRPPAPLLRRAPQEALQPDNTLEVEPWRHLVLRAPPVSKHNLKPFCLKIVEKESLLHRDAHEAVVEVYRCAP